MKERLVILAGGISSRMRKSITASNDVDARFAEEAVSKPKSMIGVGDGERPFLDYLLLNARKVGYRDVVIVVGEADDVIRNHYGTKERENDFHGLSISYAVQKIPEGRSKPMGTADALLQALLFRKDWKGEKFTVCNSDNLYSVRALKLMIDSPYPNALIDYDRSALEFPQERIEKFAVTLKDKKNFLLDILEKPSPADIKKARGKDGMIGVSMNIFRMDYDMILPCLEQVPEHPTRKEKELPAAVIMMVNKHPKSCYAFPLEEHVPDLTQMKDIVVVQKYLNEEYGNLSF